MEYIYLLQEREFIKTDELIYKLGKSKQSNLKRFKQYPKESNLLLQTSCEDCDKIEKELIRTFKLNFKHRNDIGHEYFEGDYKKMKNIINKMVSFDDYLDDIIFDKSIESYEEYKNSINYKIKIIITNKTSHEGYIKVEEGCYNKIYSKYDKSKNTLMKFIKHYSNNLKFYNYELIIKDIITTNYINNIDIHKLQYNEHPIILNNIFYIFDATNQSFNLTEEYNDIICDSQFNKKLECLNYNENNKNILLVDEILNKLINSNSVVDHYKKLCNNILIESSELIIFYDYSDDNNFLLTKYISNLMDNLSYDRCVIIRSQKNKEIFNKINKYKKLGYKNIIINSVNSYKNIYNDKKILDNELISHDNILTNDMLINYLLWCTTKIDLKIDNTIELNKLQLSGEKYCDTIISWFKENYELTDDESNVLKLKDIYKRFTESHNFEHMTKAEKKKYNKSYFVEYIEKNIFFRKYYCAKSKYIRTFLKYWKLKDINEESEEEHLLDS